jgi:hypothetical protein
MYQLGSACEDIIINVSVAYIRISVLKDAENDEHGSEDCRQSQNERGRDTMQHVSKTAMLAPVAPYFLNGLSTLSQIISVL